MPLFPPRMPNNITTTHITTRRCRRHTRTTSRHARTSFPDIILKNPVRLLRFDAPVTPFPRFPLPPRNFHETFIQRQIMADRVFPRRFSVPVKRKIRADPIVNLPQGHSVLRRGFHCHYNKHSVGIRRFSAVIISLSIAATAAAAWR